ncbi:MAG: hypothetical protein KKF48_01500 [Nanoarchaeota archaeon]|nr:hypothetical protein [Nanoarchaeota archaeon]MBU1027697.1 hypothetical protein [Nanoarchaeota archaeon]
MNSIDLLKEEVYITHIYTEGVKTGRAVPLGYISKVRGKYIQGLDLKNILTEKEILRLVKIGTLRPVNETKLTQNKRPFLFEGLFDPKRSNRLKAEVYLVDRNNPVDDKERKLLTSYLVRQ